MLMPPAKLTTGQPYTGNNEHRGKGAMRHCATCGTHRAMGAGWRKLHAGMSCPDCVAQACATHQAASTKQQARHPQRKQAQTHPWDAPGYRFSIDWPPGFVPQFQPATVAEKTALRAGAAASLKNADRLSQTIVRGRA